MAIRISRAVLDAVIAQARADPEREVCGLLTGSVPDQIDGFVSAVNVAADPRARFEIDPAVLIAAHRAVRSGGPGLLGCYHSHPGGVPAPSPTDAAMAAADGWLWLIVTSAGEAGWWRAGERGLYGRFVAVEPLLTD